MAMVAGHASHHPQLHRGYAAPPPAAAAVAAPQPALAPPAPAFDAAAGVPLQAEDRRLDSNGGVLVRRYTRGRLLGKGGFARCFKFTHVERNKVLAGKVVDKETLHRERAKAKVRQGGRAGRVVGTLCTRDAWRGRHQLVQCTGRGAPGAVHRACCTWDSAPATAAVTLPHPTVADGDPHPPLRVTPQHRRLRVLFRGRHERVHDAGAVPQPGAHSRRVPYAWAGHT